MDFVVIVRIPGIMPAVQSTKSPEWKCFFDDVVYSLSTSFRNPDGDYAIIV
jgi:hypothetical protein